MINFIKSNLLIIAAVAFVILAWLIWATTAKADGLTPVYDDPIVTAPAQPSHSWAGPYAGAMGAYVKAKRRVHVREYTEIPEGDYDLPPELIGNPTLNDLPGCQGFQFDCASRRNGNGDTTQTWLTGPLDIITGSHSESRTDSGFGAGVFAGHRWEVGRFVPGAEVAALYMFDSGDTLLTAEAQAGLSLGRALPYISGGVGHYSGQTGWAAGAGIDFAIGKRATIGVKAQYVDLGSGENIKAAIARVAWRF